MFIVRKKPIEVHAVQMSTPGKCETAHGWIPFSPGDWIITDPKTDDSWPIRDEFFKDNYEVLRETI